MTAISSLERLGVSATVFACSSYADDGRPLAVAELAAEAAAHPDSLSTMRWDELRELSDRGIEIGSHTVTHPHLKQTQTASLRASWRIRASGWRQSCASAAAFLRIRTVRRMLEYGTLRGRPAMKRPLASVGSRVRSTSMLFLESGSGRRTGRFAWPSRRCRLSAP